MDNEKIGRLVQDLVVRVNKVCGSDVEVADVALHARFYTVAGVVSCDWECEVAGFRTRCHNSTPEAALAEILVQVNKYARKLK